MPIKAAIFKLDNNYNQVENVGVKTQSGKNESKVSQEIKICMLWKFLKVLRYFHEMNSCLKQHQYSKQKRYLLFLGRSP